MKYLPTLASLAAVLILCSGCWPLLVTSSPGAHGVVADVQTRAPVADAQVEMAGVPVNYIFGPVSPGAALTNTRPPTIITGTNGQFAIAPTHRWIIYYPSPAMMPARGILVVRRDGFRPALVPVMSDTNAPLGKIWLRPIDDPVIATADNRDLAFMDGSVLHVSHQDGAHLQGVRLVMKLGFGADNTFESDRAEISEDAGQRQVNLTMFDIHVVRDPKSNPADQPQALTLPAGPDFDQRRWPQHTFTLPE